LLPLFYMHGQVKIKFNSHFLYRIAENSRAISITHFGSVKIFFLKNLGHTTIVSDTYVSKNNFISPDGFLDYIKGLQNSVI